MRKAWLVLVPVLIVVAWTGVWFYAARVAGREADAWIAAEATQGRDWTCPNRSIGGYPLAISIACNDATFAGQAMEQGVDASVAGLIAETSILHPRRVAVALTPPFAYRTSDGATDLKATWKSLAVDLDGIPDIASLGVRGEAVAVDGTFGETGRQGGQAAQLDATFELTRDPANPTIDFTIAVDGAPIAALDQLVGGDQSTDIALVGRLDRADVGDARTPEEAMEHWRQAGGRVALGEGRMTRGGAKVVASGTLGLDFAHRPKGRLDAQFVGLEPILARYGISGNLAAAGSLLSSLFGGGAPAPAPAEPGALALPISFRDGHLGVGPITTPIALPPLY